MTAAIRSELNGVSSKPIDRRVKDALWHLTGLWARVMYVLIILNLLVVLVWLVLLAMKSHR